MGRVRREKEESERDEETVHSTADKLPSTLASQV